MHGSNGATIGEPPVELAFRANDGLEVTLLWSRDDNSLLVAFVDRRSGESFALPIVDESPLDVFHHPWAYAAARGISRRVDRATPVCFDGTES